MSKNFNFLLCCICLYSRRWWRGGARSWNCRTCSR